MKYRKKPVIVNAFHYTSDKLFNEWNKLPDWIKNAYEAGILIPIGGTEGITIKTLEGDHTAKLNDFIIQGVKGELYPCKPDIFEQTYEPVEP